MTKHEMATLIKAVTEMGKNIDSFLAINDVVGFSQIYTTYLKICEILEGYKNVKDE